MIQTKIKLNYTGNPSEGSGMSYGIFVLGVTPLVYNNGLGYLNIEYVGNLDPNEFPNKVALGLTKDETIDNTLVFLNYAWSHPSIVYSRDLDSIYATLTINETVSVNYSDSPNILISVSVIRVGNDFTPIYLKYFLQYYNIVGDFYKCEIFTKTNPNNASVEIHGKAIIDKAYVKNHLDALRGGGLSLELEASKEMTLEDFYTEKEQDFSVRLYKNGILFFNGYINPEGLFQSYTRDKWIITLDCVDGLGSLSNLSFVDSLGFPYIGKIKAIDIIYNCLVRSGFLLPINVSINTLYDGLTFSDTLDILTKIYLNGDRFQKLDNDTIMSCEEVLKSVLDLFCACITQQDGEWYIYKPNELFSNSYVKFKRYSIDNVYIGNKTKNLNSNLGSQIDNFYPHHCSGNQNIQIKGSISKFRINYKYGFETGLLLNSTLKHNGSLVYPNWTINGTNASSLILDPLDFYGIKMTPSNVTTKLIATSDPVHLLDGYTFSFNLSLKSSGDCSFRFYVRAGDYYMKSNGEWTTTPIKINIPIFQNTYDIVTRLISIPSYPLPVEADVTIEIFVPTSGSTNPSTYGEVHSVDLINNFVGDNLVGEFHTVERAIRVSSNVKEVKTIYNGDNAGVVYLGAIFKDDQITPTETWSRNGRLESFPILRIAAEEELRISQKPLKEFKGSIYGYIPYLSIININNVGSKFMFLEYSYDTMTNIGNYKLLELFASEIQDIIYKFTYDYGETVKPTIVS